jgi:AraC-like DNA-binding protein
MAQHRSTAPGANLNTGDFPPYLASCRLAGAREIRAQTRTQARACVERIFFSHHLNSNQQRGDVDFVLRSSSLGGTSFNFIRYGVDIDVSARAGEADRYVLVAPLSGKCLVSYVGRTHDVRPGGFVILKPSAPFDFSMSSDHSHLAVGVSRATLTAVMNRQFGAFREPQRFSFLAPEIDKQENYAILPFLAFACDQIANRNPSAAKQSYSRILESAFISLMAEFMSGVDTNGGQRGADRTPDHVLSAERFMRDRLEEPTGVGDIVAAAGVPMRTLYYSFKKHRGISPQAWMKSERLRLARQRLLDPRQKGLTVTDVATRYCNSNLGRFARDYHKEFGEYPSQTLQRGSGALI